MQIINQYILRELLKVFCISAGFLTVVLFMDKILYLTELIVNRGVTFFEVVQIMFYISPAFLALTIPISVLVAPVVVFNQFSSDNEWIAMKGNGWSFLELMRPVLYFSLIAYFLANVVMFFALPWGNQSFKQLLYEIVRQRANIEIKPNVFNKDFDNLVVLVKEHESESELKDIFIADSTASETPKIIVAQTGAIVSNPRLFKIQLQLKNGTIHDLGEERKNYQMLNFDRYDLTLDLPNSEKIQKKALLGNRELPLRDLLKKIRQKKREGFTAYPAEVELSKKFSIPFTCLIFGLFGAPLGIKSSRSGKSGSYAIAAAAIAIYYVAFISSQNLGSIGKINSYFSVWIPNLLFGAVMAVMLYKMQKEIPFKFLNWLWDQGAVLLHFFRKVLNKIGFQDATAAPQRSPVFPNKQTELEYLKKQILKRKMKKLKLDKLTRRM